MPKISSSRFTLHRETRTYTVERSDLGKTFEFSQLYPDAADVGLTLVSPTTGHEADYYLSRIDEDDHEIRAWELLPTPEALRRYPILTGTRITIFND